MSGSGGGIRAAVVAGSFYAPMADALARDVDDLLRSAHIPELAAGEVVRGVVAPHAGYAYSGPVAASAYRFLRTAPTPTHIVILGPSHFEPLVGLAVTRAGAWRSPLGDVAIDDTGRAAMLAAGAHAADGPHRSEHSIEVQLPFVQRLFPGVPVVPVAVGHGDPEVGAAIVGATLDEDGLLIISTDLSHFLTVEEARRLDARTATAIEALDVAALRADHACGVEALRVGLAWARGLGYEARRLDLRSSAETSGDAASVVGYGAFGIVRTRR